MDRANVVFGPRRRLRGAIVVLAMGLAAWRAPLLNAAPWWYLDGGDINGDGVTDLADPIALLGYLFAGGPAPSPCGPCDPIPGERVPPWGPIRSAGAGKGDVDANGAMDLADPVRLLMHLFNAGPAPESCGVCFCSCAQGGPAMSPLRDISGQYRF